MPNADLERRIDRLEDTMATTQAILQQVAASQQTTQTQLNQLSNRMDEFVFQSQRLFSRLGEMAERHDAGLDSLHDSVERLVRNSEGDRAESAAFRLEMQSMVSRLDALVNYLMNQR
jgi:chromosome segregation ATPase